MVGEPEAADAAGTFTLVAQSPDDGAGEPVGIPVAGAIALCVAVTVLFGIWPAPVVDFAHRATLLFH